MKEENSEENNSSEEEKINEYDIYKYQPNQTLTSVLNDPKVKNQIKFFFF